MGRFQTASGGKCPTGPAVALVFDWRNSTVLSPIEVFRKGEDVDVKISGGGGGAVLVYHQISGLEFREGKISILYL